MLAHLVKRRTTLPKAAGFIVAQLSGAIVGVILVHKVRHPYWVS